MLADTARVTNVRIIIFMHSCFFASGQASGADGTIQCSHVNNCSRATALHLQLAAPSTLAFQFSVVPDQPQIRASETKPNPNVTQTLVLTRILTLTLLTIRTPLNLIVATRLVGL